MIACFVNGPIINSQGVEFTMLFKTQTRHTNVMFDDISGTPSLQRVLTDVYVKPIGISQSHWSKHHFKIDSGACGNLMPLSMFKSLYNQLPSSTTVNGAVHLLEFIQHPTSYNDSIIIIQ